MKRFEQLHIDDQNRLLITLLLVTGDEGNNLAKIAETRGATVLDVWRDICADAGLDECQPWAGFPARPIDLPPAPGGARELPEAAADALAKIVPRQAN